MSGDSNDLTKTSSSVEPAGSGGSNASGWLSSSGSIDHGRFPPGSMLEDRYRIIGLLGRGGMGEVYRADDLRLGQQVALKFLPPALATDARRLAQFHNEVRTARQVSHPNVCRVYDIGELQVGGVSLLFITMEYVGGEDLSSLLRRIGRLPEERAIELARQICAGLAAAHERGVLHRDLKPANIMLDETGKVRIMDFSLASAGAVEDIRAGTPAYMAPEQLEGREVTQKSDIYARGLVLYELFTGRRAIEAKTIADLVAHHHSGSVMAPSTLVTSLDPAVDRAIMRCLDPDPKRRPASALAVAASLPGGDPLAAALAAGETPSPEMVAAAGGESAAVSPAAGRMWLLLVLAALGVLGIAADRVAYVARSSFTKPVEVLIDRAEGFRRQLGYADTSADRTWGYSYDTDFINWAVGKGDGARGWTMLTASRPGALRFWYRTSPQPMVPFDNSSGVSVTDPPLLLAGMAIAKLDMEGRLRTFEAVAPQFDANAAAASTPATWSTAFEAAGLDISTFAETEPHWTPRGFADERKAWEGPLPGTALRARVEAASYHGRLVMFDLIGDWTRPTRQQAASLASTAQWANRIGNLILMSLPIGAALMARRNLKSGRADRRGSFNLAAAVFVIFGAVWVLSPHVGNATAELSRFFTGMGMALLQAGLIYLIYLALEPFVRKTSPMMLVTWSRLTSGRWRDPLVGRDLLIGTAVGAAMTAAALAYNFVPPLLHSPEPMLNLNANALSALINPRFLAAGMIARIDWALQNAMLIAMMLATLRQVLRSMTAATIVTLFVLIVMSNRGATIESGYFWLDLAFNAAMTTAVMWMLRRLGLFAAVTIFYVNSLANEYLLTFDNSRLYSTQSFIVMAVIAGLAVTGLWMARAGEPLLRNPERAS